MPESQSILSNRSPWSESFTGLTQRINALKWMLIVFSISLYFFAIAEVIFIWPTSKMLLREYGLSDLQILKLFRMDLSLGGEIEAVVRDYLFDAWTSGLGTMLIVLPFVPVLVCLLFYFVPFVRNRLFDLWMAPIYRAWTLRGVSEVLKSDHELVQVLKASSELHPLYRHRRSMAQLAKNVHNGLPIEEAFARSGMIRQSQRGLLALAQEPRQLAWALRQIAERNYFRWIEWYSMLLDATALFMVILIAMVVGFFGYIQFQFLAWVISHGT